MSAAPVPSRTIDVAVVGAGFAGLAMAMALLRAGHEDIAVLERAAAIGGTWRDNTYPGVACDVPSHLYGFAAHPHPGWSRRYAPGAEIQSYLERVADAAGLRRIIRTRSPMMAARWTGEGWDLEIGGAEPGVLRARSLVLACGRLTEPFIPAVDGLESFPGPLFHTARWDHDAPIRGSRVGVVGSGASAVQLVPELVRRGARVTLFQRTPPWIVPRGDHAYSAAEQDAFRVRPDRMQALRADLYREGEARFASRSGDPDAAAAAAEAASAHRARQVADPELRAALTPSYAFGCTRVLLSDDFYPAVASDAVTLEPSALAAVRGRTLVAASGAEHEADVLVLATGFLASRQPYADLVTGEHETLAQHWSAGMTSYGSTVVAGFPDLYVLNGPNASLGHNSSVLMTEAQAEYVVRALAERDRRGAPLRVRPEAEKAYSAQIDEAAAATPWLTGGCRTWYVDDRSGRLTLLWPGTVDAFRRMLDAGGHAEFLPAGSPTGPHSSGGES